MFARVPWAKVWDEAVNIGAGTTTRGTFAIPTLNLFMTFRCVLSVTAGGSAQVSLRFGHTIADAALAANGLDFPVLTVANSSSLRSVVFDPAAVAPAVVGSPPGILPPVVAVILTAAAGTNLTYQVHATGLSVD